MSKISEFIASVVGIRESVASLDAEIVREVEKVDALVERSPHTDDIVALVEGGLDNCTKMFHEKMAAFYATPAKYDAASAEHLENVNSANLLCLSQSIPGPGGTIVPTMPDSHVNGDLSVVAVSHFLKKLIIPELPDLVERHFPQAKKGIKSADRKKQLAAARERISQLTKQKSELVAALGEVRKVAAPEAKKSPEVALHEKADLLREAIADCDHDHGNLVVRHPDMKRQLVDQLKDVEDQIAALRHGERA